MQINHIQNKTLSVLTASRCSRLALGAFASAILATSSFAADSIWTRGAGNLNWNVGGNWSFGAVPQADPFEEEGVIENGDTVFISVPVIDAAGIRLGGTAATTGGLEVRSGGSINVVDSTSTPNGSVSVGVNGQGTLAVQPGGSLSAQFLGVNAQSSLTVGGTGGVATLAVANAATLNGATRITGSGHTVSTGSLTFGGTSSHVADIRSASHSTIRANGVAALNGAFRANSAADMSPPWAPAGTSSTPSASPASSRQSTFRRARHSVRARCSVSLGVLVAQTVSCCSCNTAMS